MEELLNKLIEKGWKPRGYECGEDNGKRIHYHKNRMRFYYAEKGYKQGDAYPERDYKIRELVSKESGLWQFVCENGYIKEIETDGLEIRNWDNPRHWIVESALCDEDKLEDFILDNVSLQE